MYTIFHDFWIDTPVSNVFEAISTPYGLNNWWTLKCSGKHEIGAIWNLYFSDEFNWLAEVSLLKNNEQIEFKITKATNEWMPTSFGFILTEESSNKTKVQFYHKNWTEISSEYRVTSYCWANLLRQMKQYLEKGIITPFEERN